jgi:hypothetical protein
LKRVQQIMRDQLVKRVSDRQNDVMMKLDRGEEHDRGDDARAMAKSNQSILPLRNISCANRFATPGNCWRS